LHDIDKPQQYIIGGCVDDLWLAVSSMQMLFPATKGHIGYSGISFGGGIGALALPWEPRIQRAHLNVPTFGNQPLRLQLPTIGSGAAVQRYQRQHGNVLATLQYYDAASAARFIQQPMHVAAALFDPAVAPPGQFAIHNALPEPKSLFVLEAGHFEYPHMAAQEQALHQELEAFFAQL
jgi:cephalosporin-C deacetylase